MGNKPEDKAVPNDSFPHLTDHSWPTVTATEKQRRIWNEANDLRIEQILRDAGMSEEEIARIKGEIEGETK